MENQKLTVRPYDAVTDTEALSGIWLDASRLAHPFLGESKLIEQQRLIEALYLPNAETWVACLDQVPVGFISLLDAFIGGIFVDPDRQGFGIGRTLIAHAQGLHGELMLDVYTQNAQAMGFYAGLGFVEVSRRPVDDEGLPFENARLRLNG